MKQLQPVIWSKGTFLTPQHLQAQDRFIEDTLQFRLQALAFRPWGFQSLSINQDMLADGQFAINSASGIFPDGLLFDIPAADATPASKAIAEFFDADQTSLDVFLAVADYRERGVNVTLTHDGSSSRFVSDIVLLRDENTGMAEKPIQVARKNLRLLVEGESREGATALRVANIEKTSTGVFRLNPRFVPPLVDISASDYVVSILRGLIEILSAKSSILSGGRRQKNQNLAEFTASDIANFWLLYTINSNFPLFHHLFACKKGHPEELYGAMVSLAGSLSTFSLKVHPRDLPTYDHEELGPMFTELDEKLRMLLETVVPSNFVSLPLKLVRPSVYSAALDDDKYLTNTRMYLAMSSEAPEGEMIGRVPGLVKVCSAAHIDHLVKQALPGMALRHVANPPGSIPIKLKYQYFSLDQSGGAWEAVCRARNIAAYVPNDFPNPELEVIILLPEAN